MITMTIMVTMTTMITMITMITMRMVLARANGARLQLQGALQPRCCITLPITPRALLRLQLMLVAAEQRISKLEQEKQQLLTANEQTYAMPACTRQLHLMIIVLS